MELLEEDNAEEEQEGEEDHEEGEEEAEQAEEKEKYPYCRHKEHNTSK